jgi:DHA2 family multidrug resistance protein-like MFS transporter
MDAVTTPRAGRREWIGLAVLALPALLYSMDLTVLHLAVPKLTADLQPSSTELLWIIDIYGFMVAGCLITMGTLGDRIGRRRLLLIGAAAFGAASVVAAFSASAEMLIASRALLGVAGATIAPSTLSLIRNMFLDDRQRTTAIAVWITSFSVGGAIGPLVGGVLLEFFWWGSVFLIGVPVMVLLLVVGPRLLPEYRDPAAGRLDVLSAALSLVTVLVVIYGLKEIAKDGFAWLPALIILVGLAVGALFVRRQLTLTDPLIDLRLFQAPAFSASLATYGLGIFVAFGGFLFLPQYLQLVRGRSPLEAGLWTLPWAVGFIVGSMLTPPIVRRVRPVFVIVAGLALTTVGFAMFTQMDADTSLAVFVAGSLLMALGIAPAFTVTIDLIVAAAPPERAGAASAISETSAELGGALGIAVFGSIGVAVYRAAIADDLPAGIPPETVAEARQTLGGAVAAAEGLPEPLSTALLSAANEAFVQGLQLSAAISAALTVGIAILALLLLRHVGAGGAPGGHGESVPARQPPTSLAQPELQIGD